MEKEALFWKKLRDKKVQCQLCPHFCFIKEGEKGKCHARKNIQGKLISLVYGYPCSLALDPIEKKPLYHFHPGSMTFSIATAGCNLKCLNCQNWQISQADVNEGQFLTPEEIVMMCWKYNSRIISFTYTEPTIFYEYMIDIAKLAKKQNLLCVMVTNGFINPKPLKELLKYIDAFNVDIKSMKEKFYRENCSARLKPVLETCKQIYKAKKHLEITNLLIPGKNTSDKEIKKLVSWIKKNLDKNIPLHFSAFFPCYKMLKIKETNPKLVIRAAGIARKMGMKNVYMGNI